MRKAAERITAVLSRVIVIGFSIQIVFGVLWAVLNFAKLQEFGESYFYVQNISMITKGAEKIIRLPYYCVLYTIQLALAGFSSYWFLGKFSKLSKPMCVWGSLALLTVPMNLQCHLAVLPYSLAASFFLLGIGCAVEQIFFKEAFALRGFLKMLVCFLVCALLLPEYLYLGAVPILLLLLFRLVQVFNKKETVKRFCCEIALAAVFAGMIIGVNALTKEERYYGSAAKSVEASLASRFAWTSLLEYTKEWPGEIGAVIDEETLRSSAYYADNMALLFEPFVEKTLGEDGAKAFYKEIARIAWERNSAHIKHEIAWDIVGYTFSPTVLQLQLTGRAYEAYSGRNYEIMRQYSPVLTRMYVDYGCWWFMVSIGIAAVILGFALIVKALDRNALSREVVWSVLLVLFSLGGMILWYTMQGAGMLDYKKTIAVTCFWGIFSILSVRRQR